MTVYQNIPGVAATAGAAIPSGKYIDDAGIEYPTKEAFEASEEARLRAAAGANGTPVTPGKYRPSTADVEAIKRNLKSSLTSIQTSAATLESKGVPYLLSLCDYAVTFRTDKMQWPDKDGLRKFLREAGAEPDKFASTYTKNLVNQALAVTALVTRSEFPLHLGYRSGTASRPVFSLESPAEGEHSTRVLLAPHNVVDPKTRAGKEFIPNTNVTLVPVTFAKANKLATELLKGKKKREPASGQGGEGASAGAAIDTVKSYGMDILCGAMGDHITSKETLPTAVNLSPAFSLAGAAMDKVNAAYPDKVPTQILAAMIALKIEIDERLELLESGHYKVVPVDGGNGAYEVNPDTLDD